MHAFYAVMKTSDGLKRKVLLAAFSVLAGNHIIHALFEVLVLNHLAVVPGLDVAAKAVSAPFPSKTAKQ